MKQAGNKFTWAINTNRKGRCFVTMLGNIISGVSNEAMLFYSAWNLYCWSVMPKPNIDIYGNNLLGDTQFGFCQGHSAPYFITALVQTWTKELNSRGE
eukprot:g27327.t1